MKDKEIIKKASDEIVIEMIVENLATVQPKMLNEDQAYKKAIMRMAIEEYINAYEKEV